MQCPHCRDEIPIADLGCCPACGNNLDDSARNSAVSALPTIPGIKFKKSRGVAFAHLFVASRVFARTPLAKVGFVYSRRFELLLQQFPRHAVQQRTQIMAKGRK